MKVEIELVTAESSQGAYIRTTEITEAVEQARQILQNDRNGILVTHEGNTYLCGLETIYYIESVDSRCFVYTKTACYETRHRLYELEQMLDYRFFRCSKSMICNVKKIRSVKAEHNAKMSATLLNGEKIVINRSYIRELKKRLGM